MRVGLATSSVFARILRAASSWPSTPRWRRPPWTLVCLLLVTIGALVRPAEAAERTDWFHEARWGVVTYDVPIQKSGLIPQAFVEQLRAIGQGSR